MILIITNFILIFIYFSYFLLKLNKVKKINAYILVIGMFTVIYGGLPFLLLLFKNVEGYNFIAENIFFNYEGKLSLFYSNILSLVGFIFLIIGYENKFFFRNIKNNIYNKKNKKIITLTAWSSLIISTLSFLLWTKAYGGIYNLIKIANAVRGGFSGIDSNPLAFLKHPSRMIIFSSLLFFNLVLDEKGLSIKKIFLYIGLFISVYFSYLFLIGCDGRLSILFFLISFIWIITQNKIYKSPIKLLFGVSIIALISLIVLQHMDSITHYIRFGEWVKAPNSLLNKILRELVFITQSMQTAILSRVNNKIGFTLVNDFLNGIFAWLPTRIKPFKIQDVWRINTLLIPMHKGPGTVPCSLVSQGYYDLGIFGVILLSFLLGSFLKFIDNLVKSKNIFIKSIVAYITIFNILYIVPYCSFGSLMLIIFPVVISIILYKIFNLLYYLNKR